MTTQIQQQGNTTTIEYSTSTSFVSASTSNLTTIEYQSGVTGESGCVITAIPSNTITHSTNSSVISLTTNTTNISVPDFIGQTTITPAIVVEGRRKEVFVGPPGYIVGYDAIFFEETVVDGEQVYTMRINVP